MSAPSRFLRRAAIVGGAIAIAIAIPGQALAASSSSEASKAKVVIDTISQWQQNNTVAPFGCPDSTTYGQTITAPAKFKKITKFKFYMSGQAASGQSMVVRGEVYGWNGTMATNLVAESKPITIAFDNSDFNEVTFKVKGASVKPGEQYVLFASIDKDYESCTGNYELTWASLDGTAYSGGDFVFQNNTGNEGNWTTQPWNVLTFLDAGTKVYMKK